MQRDDSVTIYKYPLALQDFQTVNLPAGAEILCVQVQRGEPCLWATISKRASIKPRGIYIVGTGHPMPVAAGAYIGTFQLQGGALVFHVFEA